MLKPKTFLITFIICFVWEQHDFIKIIIKIVLEKQMWLAVKLLPSQLLIGAKSSKKFFRRTLDHNKDWSWISRSTDLLGSDLKTSSDRNVSKSSLELQPEWKENRVFTSFPSCTILFPSFRAAMMGPIAAVPLKGGNIRKQFKSDWKWSKTKTNILHLFFLLQSFL